MVEISPENEADFEGMMPKSPKIPESGLGSAIKLCRISHWEQLLSLWKSFKIIWKFPSELHFPLSDTYWIFWVYSMGYWDED